MPMDETVRAKPDDGGSAFPFVRWSTPNGMIGMNATNGMSLRDYFAGQALAGLAPSMATVFHREDALAVATSIKKAGYSNMADWLGSAAYQLADAMLKARALPPTEQDKQE